MTVRLALLASLALMFALALPALAQDRRGGSLDRVLPHIRQSVPGTFYDAEGPYFGSNGRATYRIKWMTPDNRIIWFSVDASTGQVLGGPPGPPPGRYRQEDDRSGWGHNAWPNRGPNGPGDNDDGGQGNWSNRGRDRGDNHGGNQGGGWGNGNGDQGGGWGGRGGRGGDRGGDRGRGGQGGHGGDNRGGGRHRNGG